MSTLPDVSRQDAPTAGARLVLLLLAAKDWEWNTGASTSRPLDRRLLVLLVTLTLLPATACCRAAEPALGTFGSGTGENGTNGRGDGMPAGGNTPHH